MECIARERRRNDPFVMWFMEPAINERMMQATVNPINTTVGEADEKWVLQPVVPRKRSLVGKIIEFGPSAHFSKEKRCCEDGHDGHRGQSLHDLLLDLVWEVSGVL